MKWISRLNPVARRVSYGYANIFLFAEYPIRRPPLFKKSRPRVAPSDADPPDDDASAFSPFPASGVPEEAPAGVASPPPAAPGSPLASGSPDGLGGVAAPPGGPHPGSHANIRTAAANPNV